MKILTVISNYNEERAIQDCIDDFRLNSPINSDLVVIDNCSRDRSLEIIKKAGVDYIWHPVNTGGSFGVIKTSFVYAAKRGYDIYCHMDGDNQHNAKDLDRLIAPIMAGDADFVIGSRFIERVGFQSLPFRRMGIRIFSSILTFLSGTEITDLTSGFRAYNKKAIDYFSNYRHCYEPCVEMILLASFAGLKVKESPVIMKPRLSGKSEINFINALKFPVFGIVSIIGTLLHRRKLKGSVSGCKL